MHLTSTPGTDPRLGYTVHMPNSSNQQPLLTLVYPRFRYPSGDYPIGVALLAAVVRKELGWRVNIIDTTFHPDMEKVRQTLETTQPDVVGIGMSTLMLGEGLAIGKMAHHWAAKVVAGSAHPSMFPAKIMQYEFIDAVIIGEGEVPLSQPLQMWQNGFCITL